MSAPVLTYDQAKARIIEALQRDAAAHDRREYQEIGVDYKAVAEVIPRDQPPKINKVMVALSFWDAWIRARNEGWKPHPHGITEPEWPVVAREVVQLLQAGSELNTSRANVFGLQPWTETVEWFRQYLNENPHLRGVLPPDLLPPDV